MSRKRRPVDRGEIHDHNGEATLYLALFVSPELQDQIHALQAERDELAERLARAEHIHGLLLNSRSWRLTRPLRDVAAARRTRIFVKNLRLLHDTLADTELAGHYWVWSGLLIGWAREGKPLAHDSLDADFCVLAGDMPRFGSAVPALIEAGFVPWQRFVTNDGTAVIYTFRRDGIVLEFFGMEPVDGRLRYYEFNTSRPTQAAASIADQERVPFEFIGRTWLKHADHDAELTAIYGPWRIPDPDWWYMNSRTIVDRTVWTRADELDWGGDFGSLDTQGVI